MIKNIAKITYDWKEIKNISKESNVVVICLHSPILNVCACSGNKDVYVNIFNNTGSDLFCLNIIDFNNNFKYNQPILNFKEFKTIKYKKDKEPRLLICYSEKANDNYCNVYISK